jgi:hypothetical protein
MAEACHQQRKVVILIALHDAGADPAMLAGDHIRFVEKHCLPGQRRGESWIVSNCGIPPAGLEPAISCVKGRRPNR